MANKIVIGFFALVVLSFVGCQWDYWLSKHLFEKYCNDGRVGQFIYETVELPDEYWELLPTEWTHRDDYEPDSRFEYGEVERKTFDGSEPGFKKGWHYRSNGGYRINKERFERDYIFEVYKSIPLSEIGPINSVETSVTRKKDSKLLGKAAGLANHQGWWAVFWSMSGTSAVTCPSGRDENNFSKFYKEHNSLVKKIFSKRSDTK